MREIKFRAWDEDGFMFTPTKIEFGGSDTLGIKTGKNIPQSTFVWNGDTFGQLGSAVIALMQYTGLKDKNGKEIYEGDIISITEVDEDSAFGSENTDVVEVKWINEIAQWRAVFQSGRRTELHLSVSLPTVIDCTVIGNIYENPELLKKL